MPAPEEPAAAEFPPSLDTTIPHPGSIKINVQGAFIVDEETASPALEALDAGLGYKHDTKDIRLPNHKAIVSHVAVDVGPESREAAPHTTLTTSTRTLDRRLSS